MPASLATAPSGPGNSEQLNPTAARALEWAREWYPAGQFAVTGVTDAEATVLVEIDGDIRLLKYEDLDADVPRCAFCGRPLWSGNFCDQLVRGAFPHHTTPSGV